MVVVVAVAAVVVSAGVMVGGLTVGVTGKGVGLHSSAAALLGDQG